MSIGASSPRTRVLSSRIPNCNCFAIFGLRSISATHSRPGATLREYSQAGRFGERALPYVHSVMVCTLGSLRRDKVFAPDAGELVARLLCSEMLAVNVAFTNTQPTPDGRQAGSWELRPTTPRQQPAICGIFDQSYLAGFILATRLPMTCGSCSPEEPSSV
jgi:hypothetical protein